MQRRQRLHADRHCQCGTCTGNRGDLHGAGPVPHGRDLQPVDGRLLEPDRRERHGVQRRQRLHDRPTPARRGPAPGPTGDVHGADQCHAAGTCDPATGPARTRPSRRDGLQRRQRLHDGRRLPRRELHRDDRDLHGAGSVPHGRDLRPGDGVLGPVDDANGTTLRRRERLHHRRQLPGGGLRGGRAAASRSTSCRPSNTSRRRPLLDTDILTATRRAPCRGSVTVHCRGDQHGDLHARQRRHELTNTGTTPFVWGSYQVTMEYLSAPSPSTGFPSRSPPSTRTARRPTIRRCCTSTSASFVGQRSRRARRSTSTRPRTRRCRPIS